MSFWSVIPIIGDLVGGYQKGKAAQEDNAHAEEMASLQQFAAEFGNGRTWFDSLIDGINRLPRPAALAMIGSYFYMSWNDPAQLAVINGGLQTIPEPMWWLLTTVIMFYFGGRVEHHWRKDKGFGNAAEAATKLVLNKRKASDWLQDKFPDVQLKVGVVIDGLDIKHMAPVITAARNLYNARGVPLVITSAIRPKSDKSLHDEGLALDLRSRTLSDPQAVTAALSTALGEDYDVIFEGGATGGAHIHVEYDPKGFFLGEMIGG